MAGCPFLFLFSFFFGWGVVTWIFHSSSLTARATACSPASRPLKMRPHFPSGAGRERRSVRRCEEHLSGQLQRPPAERREWDPPGAATERGHCCHWGLITTFSYPDAGGAGSGVCVERGGGSFRLHLNPCASIELSLHYVLGRTFYYQL